jgi:hypothetical protein
VTRGVGALLALTACQRPPEPPAADAWTRSGPGVPAVTFEPGALWTPCALLDGGPEDVDHHNLVTVFDGWVVVPWAPEEGGGGVALFDLSEPCAPERVGSAFSATMRESHTLPIATRGGRDVLAVDQLSENGRGGVGFWDVTDPTAPVWLSELELDGVVYPDSYTRVSLSTFWQGDLLFVSAGFNGVYVVDVAEPSAPALLGRWNADPPILAGTLHVVGTVGLLSSAGLSRAALLDLTDPLAPAPLADLDVEDADGVGHSFYFASWLGKYGVFARNHQGGGPVIYDLTDPTDPTFQGDAPTPDEGGYSLRQNDFLFFGDSETARVYDLTDPTALAEVGAVTIPGDVDTITPLGNLAAVSVDEGAADGEGTAIVPWSATPDATPPRIELSVPADGATGVSTAARVGLSFDEALEPRSVFAGSVRVTDDRGYPVDGLFDVQEGIVNFTPAAPWWPDTVYRVTVPAGGVADVSGNRVDVEWSISFETGAASP